MFDFEQIVEGLLLVLESKTDLLKEVSSKQPGVDEYVLNEIYACITSTGGKYHKPSNWEPYIDYTYLLNAVLAAACNDRSIINANEGKAKANYKTFLGTKVDDVEQFYNFIGSNWNSTYTNSLKTIDKTNLQDFNQFTKRIYQAAISAKSASAIKENIFNTLVNETIINSLVKIFQTRLNKLQKAKISINMLVAQATNMNLSTYDIFLKDLFINVNKYASGSKPSNKDIIEVLRDIRIEFENLLNIALQTNKLYTTYLRRNYPNWNSPGIDKTIYDKNNNPQQMYIFAKEGKLTGSAGAGKGVALISGYNLTKIQADNTEEGKELIKIIKDICAGVNEGPGASERLAAVGAAAGSLAAIGGVKSGFSM
jgi:hypothetical protein